VAYHEIVPQWPNEENFAKVDGRVTNIELPKAAATGRFTCEECRYGRVIEVGIPVERNTCRPLEVKLADAFDAVVPGAYICIRTTQNWKTGPNEFTCNSFDIISVDTNPIWAPKAAPKE
jgi:hypothetical protein